jgi:hypothetical protein
MVGDQGMHIVDPADNSPGQPLAAAHAHAPPAVHWRVAPTIDRRPVTDGRAGRRTGRGARLNRCSALAVALASVVALAGPLACGANAGEVAHLRAHLNPNHLGASTTIGFSLAINPTGGTSVSPLTGFSFGLPRGMGFLESTLGLQECQRAALLASGLSGCPDDSRLGTGHVSVELPFASGPISARASVTPMRAPSSKGSIISAFLYFNVLRPVFGRLVLSANLDESSGPGAQALNTGTLEPIALGPEGPDVVVRELTARLGPKHLTYYKHERAHTGPYKPTGLTIPTHCPRKGFLFSASLSFLDGTHTTAVARVHCPR